MAKYQAKPDNILQVLAKMVGGDTMELLPGVYVGTIIVPNSLSGCTFRSVEDHAAVLVGAKPPYFGMQLGVEQRPPLGCNEVCLEGIRFAFSRKDGLRTFGSNIIIRECLFDYNGVDFNEEDRKEPIGQGLSIFGGQSGVIVENCIIQNNGCTLWDHGIYANGSNHRFYGNIVRGNAGYGFHMYNNTWDFILEQNQVYDNGTGGIYAKMRNRLDTDPPNSHPISVVNNVSVRNGTYGLTLIDGTEMPLVLHNVLLENGKGAYATGGSCPLLKVPPLPEWRT